MRPLLKFSGILRSIKAIGCTAAIAITVGCGGPSSPEPGDSSLKPPIAPAQEDAAAEQRAQALLAQMTLDEKIDMLHGELNLFYGFYNGPIARLGIPALTMADGPMVVRIAHPDVNDQRATQLPSSIALAATWDTNLAEQYGRLTGRRRTARATTCSSGPSSTLRGSRR
jgi:beta-glucosidase